MFDPNDPWATAPPARDPHAQDSPWAEPSTPQSTPQPAPQTTPQTTQENTMSTSFDPNAQQQQQPQQGGFNPNAQGGFNPNAQQQPQQQGGFNPGAQQQAQPQQGGFNPNAQPENAQQPQQGGFNPGAQPTDAQPQGGFNPGAQPTDAQPQGFNPGAQPQQGGFNPGAQPQGFNPGAQPQQGGFNQQQPQQGGFNQQQPQQGGFNQQQPQQGGFNQQFGQDAASQGNQPPAQVIEAAPIVGDFQNINDFMGGLQAPTDGSKGFAKLANKDYLGALILVRPISMAYDVLNSFGQITSKRATVNYIVIDGPSSGDVGEGAWVPQTYLANDFDSAMKNKRPFVLGRLVYQVPPRAKNGKESWMMTDATPDDMQMAFAFAQEKGWLQTQQAQMGM